MTTRTNTASRRVAINASVTCAELGDEVALLNVETGIYFGLDDVGLEIWRLLAEGAGEAEIYDRLLAEYDVDPTQWRADLAAFLDVLEAKGLVQGVTRYMGVVRGHAAYRLVEPRERRPFARRLTPGAAGG